MKAFKNTLISILLSLAFHWLLLNAFGGLPMGKLPPPDQREDIETPPESFEVTILPVPPTTKPEKPKEKEEKKEENRDLVENQKPAEMFNPGKIEQEVKEIFQKEKLYPEPTKLEIKVKGIDTKPHPALKIAGADLQQPCAPRPEIIAIDGDIVKPTLLDKRTTIAKVERIDVPDLELPSLVAPGDKIVQPGAGSYGVGLRMGMPTLGGPAKIPDDDLLPPDKGIEINPPSPIIAGSFDKGDDKIIPFDDFVDVSVVVKENPITGGGYFMATIGANEKSDSVKEIAKDVVILLDRSTSISESKLHAFKTAASNALHNLNLGDQFNIVTFTDKLLGFKAQSVNASSDNIAAAQAFIKKQRREGTTDVFKSLVPFVKSSSTQNPRPLTIFMLTDGISTVNIYKHDDDAFLREIAAFNPGKVSIFPFSAGKDTNRNLLDFLGYLNRGESPHANKIEDIDSMFNSFFAAHSNLLICDIEYSAPASLVKEIYPKKLLNLYRGAKVKIFGKYGPQDSELLLTIYGYDANNAKRDMRLRRLFADCPHTTEAIDQNWASTKINYLLAERMLSKDPGEKERLNREINQLSRQFGLVIPY